MHHDFVFIIKKLPHNLINVALTGNRAVTPSMRVEYLTNVIKRYNEEGPSVLLNCITGVLTLDRTLSLRRVLLFHVYLSMLSLTM